MDNNMGFNKYPGSNKDPQFTIAYNSSNQYEGREEALFTNVEEANKIKNLTFENILNGNANLDKFEILVEKNKEQAVREVLKAIQAVKGKYIPSILQSVEGRIAYLLRTQDSNTNAFETFTEIDKISKDITYYQEKSPHDYSLQKKGVKEQLDSITQKFNNLIDLYYKKVGVIKNNATKQNIDINDKSGNISDENFIQQTNMLCVEANDSMMDIESMVVSENFSRIYKLLNEIKDTNSKEYQTQKIEDLKTILKSELSIIN